MQGHFVILLAKGQICPFLRHAKQEMVRKNGEESATITEPASLHGCQHGRENGGNGRTTMGRIIHRTGKKLRPKTAIKGKRYRCAICHKRSPKPVKTPAPWYCSIWLGRSGPGE